MHGGGSLLNALVFAVGTWAGSAAHLSNPGLAFRVWSLQTFDGMNTGPASVAVAVFLREKEIWLGNKVTRVRSCPLPSQCKNPWDLCPWGFKHFWQPGLQEKPLEKPLLLPNLSQFIKESRNRAERCKRSVSALSFLLFDGVCYQTESLGIWWETAIDFSHNYLYITQSIQISGNIDFCQCLLHRQKQPQELHCFLRWQEK